MPAKKKSTRWAPGTWQRYCRGVLIWVDEMYSVAPKWEWSTGNGDDGRETTKLKAMKAAEAAVKRSNADGK